MQSFNQRISLKMFEMDIVEKWLHFLAYNPQYLNIEKNRGEWTN